MSAQSAQIGASGSSAGATDSRERSAGPLGRGAEIATGYEVIEHLRRGNDLDVYDAWSRERGTRCIVKALRPDRGEKGRARAALTAEGRLLERLSHPHIVRAYETIEAEPAAVVLETLSGATLGHLIEHEPQPSTAEIAHLGIHLGSAIRYLHSHGILHLDLKPSNVIAEGGRAKLIDLSLARAPGASPGGLGTWAYLSPEQARGGELTPAADIWGLGSVVFEAATGEAPFDDDADAWMSFSSGSERPSWISETGDEEPDRYPQLERRARHPREVAEVDPALGDLIQSCLEPEPAARPPIEEILAVLEPLAGLPPEEQRWREAARVAQPGSR